MINAAFFARPLIAGLAAVLLMGGTAVAQDAAVAEAAAPAAVTVGANLNISPKRLTFDRPGKSATIYIFNQGQTAATFDISLIDRVMLPSGQITPLAEALKKPELVGVTGRLKSAQPMLLATPRRATLAPGKGQTIRIRVTPGAEGALEAGEYRSHLTVTTIPPRDIGLTAEQASQPSPDELKFVVYSVFGISVPVIVRLGETDVRAGIENLALTYAEVSPDGVAPAARTALLNFDLARLGTNSLFGNLEVKDAKGDVIGLARGVGVYTEIDRRAVQIPLMRAPQAGERLEITFTDDDTSPGKVLAQSAIAAP